MVETENKLYSLNLIIQRCGKEISVGQHFYYPYNKKNTN